MATQDELTDEQIDVVRKVEKLLRLAASNNSPEEAAQAAAKAQALLTAYNLTAVDVSADADKSAVREKLKIKGGAYQYQRDLWAAVAQLNFCLHFVVVHRVPHRRQKDRMVKSFHHTVVGRLVNTRSTQNMALYLQQTIERAVAERWTLSTQRLSAEATAFREGAADHVVMRLHEKRRQALSEERAKAEAARAATSTAQALTIAAHSDAEREANLDVIYGEGWSAKRRAERQAQAEARKAADDAYTAWAAANPAEAKAEADRARKEQKRRDRRAANRSYNPRSAGPTAREKRAWTTTYAQGWDVGAQVGLDQQAEGGPRATQRRLT